MNCIINYQNTEYCEGKKADLNKNDIDENGRIYRGK